jgi:hypothetical protein
LRWRRIRHGWIWKWREQLSVNLAQMQEGRRSLRQAEEARVAETGSEGVRPYSDRSTIRQ